MITTATLIVTFAIFAALMAAIIASMVLDLSRLNNLRKQLNLSKQHLPSMSLDNNEWMKDLRKRAWAELKEEV